jgi:AraC family transcriptional regulator
VRDYVEVHLDDDPSLTMLADIACLSPYHFSRSFTQATEVGPQRYAASARAGKNLAASDPPAPCADRTGGWVR